MLPKKHRLIKKQEFGKVFRNGTRATSKFLSLRIQKTANAFPRIGFVVGQRISKKAIARNRVKRRLRASFGEHIKKIGPGLDVIVVPAPEIVEKSFREISTEVEKVLRKARLL